ncbi:hypothetical protein FHETE_3267 [Fusarium heterosporum]|uniref:2EXR domain-containing protein n=1 Tax=Fusarium heterosporum TaxID=42747 RepID=A0A8H5WWT5_FUSHE|nr:hypothetical protein FHETE_3267 [Fusarium heterosporum]
MTETSFSSFARLPYDVRHRIYILATPRRVVYVKEGPIDVKKKFAWADEGYRCYINYAFDRFCKQQLESPTFNVILHPDLAHFSPNWESRLARLLPTQIRLEEYGFTSNLTYDERWPADKGTFPIQPITESLDVAFEMTRESALYSEARIPPFLHVCVESRLALERWGYRLFFSTRTAEPRTWFHPGRDRLYIPNQLCPDEQDEIDKLRTEFYPWDFRCTILSNSFWDIGQFSVRDLKRIKHLVLGTNHIDHLPDLHDYLEHAVRLVPNLEELFLENWSLDHFRRWVHLKAGHFCIENPWVGPIDCIPVEDMDIVADVYWGRGQHDWYHHLAPVSCLTGLRNHFFHEHRRVSNDPFHVVVALDIEENLSKYKHYGNYRVPSIRNVSLLPEAYTDLFLQSRHKLWSTLQSLSTEQIQRVDFKRKLSRANQFPPPFNIFWAEIPPPYLSWPDYHSHSQGQDLLTIPGTDGPRIVRLLLQAAYLDRYEIEEPKFNTL